MRSPRWKTYGLGAGGMLVVVMAILLATGWSSAVAKQLTDVFVTNDAAHPVPVQEQRTDANGNIKVHEQGTANVNVVGKVSTQEGIPATQFSEVVGFGTVSGPDPAGTSYAITSVSFTNFGNPGNVAQVGSLAGEYGSTTDCQSFQGGGFNTSVGPQTIVPVHDTVTMTFPQPFVIKPKSGAASCLVNNGAADATVVGYRF